MLSRFSKVNHIKIKSVSSSSVIQIGDSEIINGFSRALAVQREAEIFLENEGNFTNYSIFSELIPLSPIDEALVFQRINLTPCIRVSNIVISGVAASSIVHIGSSCHVNMEARIKHIRHLLDED